MSREPLLGAVHRPCLTVCKYRNRHLGRSCLENQYDRQESPEGDRPKCPFPNLTVRGRDFGAELAKRASSEPDVCPKCQAPRGRILPVSLRIARMSRIRRELSQYRPPLRYPIGRATRNDRTDPCHLCDPWFKNGSCMANRRGVICAGIGPSGSDGFLG
jgi:hypothetical protein